jgi:hypothetical protein
MRAKLGGPKGKKEEERERVGGAEGVLLAQRISEDDYDGTGEAIRTDNAFHSSRTSFNTAKQRPVTMESVNAVRQNAGLVEKLLRQGMGPVEK